MRRILLFCLSLLFIQCSSEKYLENDFYSEATLKSEREKFLDKSINQTITESLLLPLNDSTEEKYQSAFWAMEIIQYRSELTDSVINNCFSDLELRSSAFQRAFLELIYTLYNGEFNKEVELFIRKTNNPKLFAMGASYLRELNIDLDYLLTDFLIRNKNLIDHPIIYMLRNEINSDTLSLPPLLEILKQDFNNKLVIYSLQRKSRDYPGLLIIKRPDGKFLRDESGEIFSFPQLARAITDLPGYITNGNTPEGILSIQGIDFSKNVFIGPSPNLQLVLPYEVSPQKYFHDEVTDTVWNKDLYSNIIPDSWKNYIPIYEAYYAGKAGRNEIIAHGTTIDPGFYQNKTYYPFTPSLGCLTTKEFWSSEDGKILESDQIKLMNAFTDAGGDHGYFVVLNIDDKNKPITLDEIESLILKAER